MPAPHSSPPARRTRVLCYIGSLAAGGAERQMVEVLKHLDRGLFEPTLLLSQRAGSLLAEVPPDVPVLCATPESHSRIPGMTRWKRWRTFARILHERQIDVVYDRTYLATLDAAFACWMRPTPRVSAAVADPEVQFAMYARRPRWLWRRISAWAYQSASCVLANSAGLRQQLINAWKLSPERIHVQPNGFDFSRIDRLMQEPGPARATNRSVILTVGRIDRDKGHRDLLEALRMLVHERQRTNLLWRIIGSGPEEHTLRTAVAAANLTAHVEFVGVVTNPFPDYRAADIFCLPSHSEGSPNVLVEALACGTPVLSTDCPSGPREILQNGDFGLLVPMRNPVALADGLERMFADIQCWQSAAERGRAAVRATLAADVVIRQLEHLLRDALESGVRCHSSR